MPAECSGYMVTSPVSPSGHIGTHGGVYVMLMLGGLATVKVSNAFSPVWVCVCVMLRLLFIVGE
jgi:hypothetical protein